jgi:hypothetical protein
MIKMMDWDQKAINRKSTIIVMRSRQLWIDLNPNIEKYQNYFSLKNPRSPYITNRNLPEGVFDHIVESLNKS